MPGRTTKKCKHLGVMVRLLRALARDGDLKKTKLAWAGKVSYDTLILYLEVVLLNGLVTLVKDELDHESVRITDKGRALLNNYETNFSELLENE